MRTLDWVVLLGTLFFIVAYGAWRTRKNRNIESFLRGDNQDKWWAMGLSVMATQASAITFLSTPGQAYESGMGFVQFYFGLPLAMVILSVTFIPLFYKLKVYTAYEFLENRFDLKSRLLTASLFLIQRSLAAGITIYAPAIILSQILGWNLNFTILFIGILVIIYTVSGGTKAVSQTHKQQMFVIFLGMFTAFGMLIYLLPDWLPFGDAIKVAGKMGKMDIIDTTFDPDNRYTIWTGLLGGLFLQLSYFGTDQSQVQRYLSGSSIGQSRLGLLFNGIVKIPMQFFILLTGVLVFMFYQVHQPPVFFNESARQTVLQGDSARPMIWLQDKFTESHQQQQGNIKELAHAFEADDEVAIEHYSQKVQEEHKLQQAIRKLVKQQVKKFAPGAEPKDYDYIFITFVMNFLPVGLVGLLLAVIFSAAMSSTAAELNALASTATVDAYKRLWKPDASEKDYVKASRLFTVMFGIFAILFAAFASLVENLIEAVNILGSLFYGTILGVFLVAFYVKRVRGNAVFIAALIAEAVVLGIFFFGDISYLWLNVVGCVAVVLFALLVEEFERRNGETL